jgi:hypothetical protein
MASKFIACFYKISIIICYIFIQRSVKYFLFYTIITLHWYYFQLASSFLACRIYKFAALDWLTTIEIKVKIQLKSLNKPCYLTP